MEILKIEYRILTDNGGSSKWIEGTIADSISHFVLFCKKLPDSIRATLHRRVINDKEAE